jgi:hypothetical protein
MMLGVIAYQDSNYIYRLGFRPEGVSRKTIIICPNPNMADDFREKHTSFKHESDSEVITISKFINDLIKNKLNDIQFTRKSELLLILAGVWKAKFSQLPKETFLQSFQYFTDLRSYTFDKELINEVLERLDVTFQQAIEYFWLVSDNQAMNINDEHKAYHLLADYFREAIPEDASEVDEEFVDKDFVFYGFTHLSGSQIDFLKSLSIRNDVFIPLPESVIKTSKKSDWINWLENDLNEEDNEIIADQPISINIIPFQKNRLGAAINNYIKHGEHESLDIYLTKKNPSYLELNEITIKAATFKSSSGMLDAALKKVQTKLLDLIKTKDCSDKEIIIFLNEISDQAIFEAKENKMVIDYRLIKITQLYKKSIAEMIELSETFTSFDLFTLYILNEIVQLNIPRIYNFPLAKDEMKTSIRGLESIEGFNRDNKTILIAKSGYGKLKSTESVYHEDIMEILASIGPVRRVEFEYQILRHKLLEVLSCPNTILFLEDGVQEYDPCWSELLNSCSLNKIDINGEATKSLRIDPMIKLKSERKELSNRFSASRLQSYLDCKQKFFFSYLNKLDTWNRPENRIMPNDLGTMEHEVIEKYLNNHDDLNQKQHYILCQKILESYLEKNFVKLEFLEYKKYLIEIVNYSKAGIGFLLNLKTIDPGAKLSFEVPIDFNAADVEYEFIGSVDCIATTKFGMMIFDFKRSAAGIPSFSAWKEFSKIQLWFYANYSNIELSKIACLGYLNLSDIENSLIMPTSKDIYQEIVDKIGVKVNKKEYSFIDLSKDFQELCHNTIYEIKNEKEFLANPKNSSVCKYCTVVNICDRGGKNE